jgi:hypothetical protein
MQGVRPVNFQLCASASCRLCSAFRDIGGAYTSVQYIPFKIKERVA